MRLVGNFGFKCTYEFDLFWGSLSRKVNVCVSIYIKDCASEFCLPV